jgi:tripartite-type tricarboxylate transporter receptor subunit TctC
MFLNNGADPRSRGMASKCSRTLGSTVIMIAALVYADHAAVAGWPDRVIRLIVPFSGGSSSDTIARIIAEKMSQRLGQPVIVQDRPGGSSIIGTQAIAKAAPDGYTLGIVNTSSQVATTVFNTNLPFDAGKEFSPIAEIGNSPFVLMAPAQTPIKTLSDYVAAAKIRPGKLTYASAGVATLSHLAGELIVSKFGVDVVHVPYPGSSNEMIDIIAGRIDMAVSTIAPTLPSYRAEKLRYFAIMDSERSPLMPDIPTVTEAHAKGCEAGLWTALVGPAGIPSEIVVRLNQLIADLIKEPEVQGVLMAEGVKAETGSSEALSALIKADLSKWKNVADGIHITNR